MTYLDNDRYQFQPRYIKAYRYLRYKPKWFVVGCCKVLWWAITGCRIPKDMRSMLPTRRKYVAFLWMVPRSMASMDMGAYWHTDELIERLRARAGNKRATVRELNFGNPPAFPGRGSSHDEPRP